VHIKVHLGAHATPIVISAKNGGAGGIKLYLTMWFQSLILLLTVVKQPSTSACACWGGLLTVHCVWIESR